MWTFPLPQGQFSLPFIQGSKVFTPASSLTSHVKGPLCTWSQRAAEPPDALDGHTHSTGSIDYIWLKHICWQSPNPHLQSSRVKAYLISFGSSLQWQVPHLLENNIRALTQIWVFWFSVKHLLFPSLVRKQCSPRQTANNPCGPAGLYDKKFSYIWLSIRQNESQQTLLTYKRHRCWNAVSLKHKVSKPLQHQALVIIEIWKYFTDSWNTNLRNILSYHRSHKKSD